MFEIIMMTLPLSLAAAVSVSSILVFFTIMVAKEKQVENGVYFIIGGLISYAVVAILVIFSLGKATPAGAPTHAGMHAITDFILAGLCLLLVIKALLKKEAVEKKKEAAMPGGAVAYLGIGALMRVASANTLPPFVAAIKEVSGAHLSREASITVCALVIFTSMLPMIIPLLLFVFNREKAVALITPVSSFLEKNKKIISNTVLIVIAVYLALHGFKQL